MVFASIITIGDELLIGQTIDTNSAWMAEELNKISVWVKRRVAVGDVWDDIRNALTKKVNMRISFNNGRAWTHSRRDIKPLCASILVASL